MAESVLDVPDLSVRCRVDAVFAGIAGPVSLGTFTVVLRTQHRMSGS